ncbi:unnamed protein product [Coregonus sp. 'balchen']|nr:unnamed protein product [Coregonus sp. 'balchen']
MLGYYAGHGVAEGVLEAAGERPGVMAGECAHWADSCFEDSSGIPGSGQGEATTYTGAAVTVPGLGQPPLKQQLYLLQFMLGEMQSHLDSSVVCVRGMVVVEFLCSCMDINGAKLKFEVQYMMIRSPPIDLEIAKPHRLATSKTVWRPSSPLRTQ